MHHTARLLDFTLSLDEVRRALQKNNELFNMEYDDTYAELKQLHMDVYLLSNILDRLFEIEETTLLPKIKEAQKKINVTS
jgi:NTP pyrophosphatase (non-canonical NTP hydrolase)